VTIAATRQAKANLVVQDNAEKGIVNFDFAVVFDKTELPEFVHEKIHTGACRANHFRKRLLRDFGKNLLRITLRAIAREQQQGTRQPFLGRVEELIYQVLLDSDVSCQHIGDEAVGELVFSVKDAIHFAFLNDEHSGGCNRGCRRHANQLARQAAFSKKIARTQNRHNGFFAGLIHHRQLHAAFLNVHDALGGIALREDGFFSLKLANFSPETCRVEKRLHIERRSS